MESIIAGATAGLITVFDLDGTFYIPHDKVVKKWKLKSWQAGFVVFNGALATFLYSILPLNEIFTENWPEAARAFMVGVAYLALIRTKIATVGGDKKIPLGLELFYEEARRFTYKRINEIAMTARREAVEELAGKNTLAQLTEQARIRVMSDALLDAAKKREVQKLIDKIYNEGSNRQNNEDSLERSALANFLITGELPEIFRR